MNAEVKSEEQRKELYEIQDRVLHKCLDIMDQSSKTLKGINNLNAKIDELSEEIFKTLLAKIVKKNQKMFS